MTDIMKNGLSRRAFLGLGATAAVAAGAGLAGCSPAASAGESRLDSGVTRADDDYIKAVFHLRDTLPLYRSCYFTDIVYHISTENAMQDTV